MNCCKSWQKEEEETTSTTAPTVSGKPVFKDRHRKIKKMDLCLKCSCNKTEKKLEKAVSHEVTGLLSCNDAIENKAVKKTDNCCCCCQ